MVYTLDYFKILNFDIKSFFCYQSDKLLNLQFLYKNYIVFKNMANSFLYTMGSNTSMFTQYKKRPVRPWPSMATARNLLPAWMPEEVSWKK